MDKTLRRVFCVLLLAITGGLNALAYDYTVSYTGRTTAEGAGYTVLNTQTISSRNNAGTVSTRNNFVLTTDNILDYIEPTAIDGYYYSVTVTTTGTGRNTTRTITIAYTTYNPYYYIAYYGTDGNTDNYTTNHTLGGEDISVINANLGRYSTLRRVLMNSGADGIAAYGQGARAPEELTTANAANYIQPARIAGRTATIESIEKTTVNWAYLYITYATKTGGETYDVEYVGAAEHQGAGYTIRQANLNRGSISSGESANPLVISYNSTRYAATILTTDNILTYITPKQIEGYTVESVTVTGVKITIKYTPTEAKYRVFFDAQFVKDDEGHQAGYTISNRNLGGGATITSEDNATVLVLKGTATTPPPSLADITVGNYLTANPVNGYTTGFYVNTREAQLGYSGNLYVNYTATDASGDELTWHDDLFEYSRIYTKTTGTTILLPEDEVAIRLWTGDQKETVTDIVNFSSPLWENPTEGEERTLNSADVNAVNNWPIDTETATYKYQGNFNNGGLTYGNYFYERTHEVNMNDATTIEIPRTVTRTVGGVEKTYKITAIQKWGFCYSQTHQILINDCTDPAAYRGAVDDHSNWHLKSVTFAYPSNVKSVGDYAFMSCKNLESIIFPSSIEYMGQGIFEMCESLTNCQFNPITAEDVARTGDDESLIGTVKFNTIKNFTFWLCTHLGTLELPDGIREIEGQQAGASLQYMLSLTKLTLPNTLERIGPHFLCCAAQLVELTIPASVTYIDGASFHGCESLKKVILLGPAAALQSEYTEGDSSNTSTTFSANTTFCKGAVSGCTFITTEDYLDSYKQDRVWSQIDEQGKQDGSTHTNTDANGNTFVVTHLNGNTLSTLPEEKRTFFPKRWITAIFPHEVPNAYNNPEEYAIIGDQTSDGFGPGTKVAVLESATRVDGVEPDGNANAGKRINVYEMKFRLLEENADGSLTIPANLPVLIYPGAEGTHLMMSVEDMASEDFKRRMSIRYATAVDAEDDPNHATIEMKGMFTSHTLDIWDFYFMYTATERDADGKVIDKDYDSPAKFWRVPSEKDGPEIQPCRCWWTVTVNGSRVDSEAKTTSHVFLDETTGIDNVTTRVVVEGIYDLQGRKLNIPAEELPRGIFIVNGKKVAVK